MFDFIIINILNSLSDEIIVAHTKSPNSPVDEASFIRDRLVDRYGGFWIVNVFRDGDGSAGSAYGSTSIDYEAHYEGHKWFIHKV